MIYYRLLLLALLFFTTNAVDADIDADSNPMEMPLLPEALPEPSKMPPFVKNRFVPADKTYEIWPRGKTIPRYMWIAVTNEKSELPPHLLALMGRNDGWMPQVCDNDCKDSFLNTYFKGTRVLWAYNMVNWGAAKANIWRYAVLYTYGGMYIDDDADFKTLFDQIVSSDDSLLLTEEGGDFARGEPCYEASYKLSDAAFYRKYQEVLSNTTYFDERFTEYFQGLKPIENTEYSPDVTIAERNAAKSSLKGDFIVPKQLDMTQRPVFFHGMTLANWAMFAAPRHPMYPRVLGNLVNILYSMYIHNSLVHMRKFDEAHKRQLCGTNYVMNHTLREMLVDGSFTNRNNSKTVATSTTAPAHIIIDSPMKPRVVQKDFKMYGGICKADFSNGYSWKKIIEFSKKNHFLKAYAHTEKQGKTSVLERLEALNNNAVMASDGKDRGIYYISNSFSGGDTDAIASSVGDDEMIIKTFAKHPFPDMDTLYSYGYVNAEIRQVHTAFLNKIKDGVPVISKADLRMKLTSAATN